MTLCMDEFVNHLIEILAIFAGHRRMAGQHDSMLHDLVAVSETIGVQAVFKPLEHGVARDVPRKDDATHDASVF